MYVLVTLLKAENSVKYHNIVPFLGPFHTQSLRMVTVALLGILVLLFQHIFLHYIWRQHKKVRKTNMRTLMKSKKKI